MGDYILKSTNQKSLVIPSEALEDRNILGDFVFRNCDGVFFYERTFVTEEEYLKAKVSILKLLDALEKEYRRMYKWEKKN